MKLRVMPYLRLFRLLPIMWVAVSLVNPVLMFCFTNRDAESLARFFGAHILLPLSFALMLALLMARGIHQPMFLLLPGARRYFKRAQAGAAVIVAAISAGIVQLSVAGAPPLAGSLGLIFFAIALGLPWEPPHRWYGSGPLLAGVVLGLGVLGMWTHELRAVTSERPWTVLTVGGVMFVMALQLAFARERTRERALSLLMLLGGNCRALARQGIARQKRNGRDWVRTPIGQSFTSWRRALWHERFGGVPRETALKVWAALAGGYLVVATGAVMIYLYSKEQPVTAGAVAQKFYSLVWCNGAERAEVPLAPFFLSTALTVVFALRLTLPTPHRLYPNSRRALLRVALRISFLRILTISVYGIAGAVLLAWLTSTMAGQPFEVRPVSVLVLPLTLLPFLPLVAGTTLPFIRMTGDPAYLFFSVTGMLWILGIVVAVTGGFTLSMFANEVATWRGVLLLAVATVLGAGIFVARARRVYLRSDLVVRGS